MARWHDGEDASQEARATLGKRFCGCVDVDVYYVRHSINDERLA